MGANGTVLCEKARSLHRNSLVVDLHTDSLIAAKLLGRDLSRQHRAPFYFSPWMLHADLPRLRKGGLGAVFFGVVTHPWPRGAWKRALRIIEYSDYLFLKNQALVRKATSPEEIERVRASGRIAALLGVEGMHVLEGEIERITALHSLGVRYITMAHFTTNSFAVSSADPFVRRATLNRMGREAVRLMNELGMIIDLAHTHTDIIREVCRLSEKPVIVSHGATRKLRPVFRNLSDDDIREVASTGGVIGLIYATTWLSPGFRRPDLKVVVDHADHIRELAGAGHIALGSDWDGFIMTPKKLRDAADLPALTALFLERGYSDEEVRGILGENFMRVFREVCS